MSEIDVHGASNDGTRACVHSRFSHRDGMSRLAKAHMQDSDAAAAPAQPPPPPASCVRVARGLPKCTPVVDATGCLVNAVLMCFVCIGMYCAGVAAAGPGVLDDVLGGHAVGAAQAGAGAVGAVVFGLFARGGRAAPPAAFTPGPMTDEEYTSADNELRRMEARLMQFVSHQVRNVVQVATMDGLKSKLKRGQAWIVLDCKNKPLPR